MKKLLIGGLVAGMVLGAMATSFSYQGVLKNATGGAVENKSPSIDFRLYTQASGGTAEWGKTFAVTLDDNGLFTLELTDTGSAISGLTNTLDQVLAAHGQGNLYLGLTVSGSSGEITPRQKLLPVPVASFAQNADAAKGDFTVSGVAKLNGIEVAGDASFTGTTKVSSLNVTGGATLGGNITATGTLTAQGGLALPSNATLAFGGKDLIPSGTIWLWWGDADNLPAGWVLCDGQNGTPDLRGRFPVGVGTCTAKDGNTCTYDRGATGGEATHKLTVDEMPSHSHTYDFTGADLKASWDGDNYFYCQHNEYPSNKNTQYTNEKGGDQAHENRPPYLAVYFIMKK